MLRNKLNNTRTKEEEEEEDESTLYYSLSIRRPIFCISCEGEKKLKKGG